MAIIGWRSHYHGRGHCAQLLLSDTSGCYSVHWSFPEADGIAKLAADLFRPEQVNVETFWSEKSP